MIRDDCLFRSIKIGVARGFEGYCGIFNVETNFYETIFTERKSLFLKDPSRISLHCEKKGKSDFNFFRKSFA